MDTSVCNYASIIIAINIAKLPHELDVTVQNFHTGQQRNWKSCGEIFCHRKRVEECTY